MIILISPIFLKIYPEKIKILGPVFVCDSPAGQRPDDLRNRPRLCGKLFFMS